jgi:hypothetical protein
MKNEPNQTMIENIGLDVCGSFSTITLKPQLRDFVYSIINEKMTKNVQSHVLSMKKKHR